MPPAVILAVGAFRSAVNFAGGYDWEYSSALAQHRRLRSLRGIHCSVENRKWISLEGSCIAFRASGRCFRRRGFRRRRCGWPGSGRCRSGRSSTKTAHVGNEIRHISRIQSERNHAARFHLCIGRFQERGQLRRLEFIGPRIAWEKGQSSIRPRPRPTPRMPFDEPSNRTY